MMPLYSDLKADKNIYPKIVPGSEPFYFPGGSIGCMLLHGFSSMPEEMRPLGEYLALKGFAVLGIRFAGHATHPNDLIRTRWTDWLDNIGDGLALLSKVCPHLVLIGQSMGGAVALTAASQYPVAAVVALSTPYNTSHGPGFLVRMQQFLRHTINKQGKRFSPDHPLYHRRELDYPAYPEIPTRISAELRLLLKAMMDTLSQVTVPTLLIHSREDQVVPFTCMQSIYDHLGSPRKEMFPVDGMDHSLVLDSKRQIVFEALEKFILSACI